MREVKFRQPIWMGGKFVYWHYWGFHKSGEFTAPCYDPYQALKESQQFTGLKDKNGKEIYEGDILTFESYQRGSKPFAIRWDTMTDFSDYSPKDKAEIIGNIYENPELLK